ncbi:hypothetical protein [Sphingomonas koreensis]
MLAAMLILAAPMAIVAAAECAAAARDVAAGEHLSADMLEPVVCDEGRVTHRLRFDRVTRSMVAEEGLPAGTYLGKLHAPAPPMLPKGARVTLRAISGPMIVEREVVTLQPARSGQRVFVRDEGGNVFAVALVLKDRGSAVR